MLPRTFKIAVVPGSLNRGIVQLRVGIAHFLLHYEQLEPSKRERRNVMLNMT
jgi:hypothetical protein